MDYHYSSILAIGVLAVILLYNFINILTVVVSVTILCIKKSKASIGGNGIVYDYPVTMIVPSLHQCEMKLMQ